MSAHVGDEMISGLALAGLARVTAGFGVVGGLYEPYRQAFLDGEATLAAALAPLIEALATAPGTECIIGLEGMLVSLMPSATSGEGAAPASAPLALLAPLPSR